MIEIITPDPWATVLALRKDARTSTPNVQPGVSMGSVDLPALLRMADQHPCLASASMASPVAEAGDGEQHYF